MAKKSKHTKYNVSVNTLLVWSAIVLVVAVQLLMLFQIKEVTKNQSDVDKRLVSDLINKAENERYTEPVISVTEERVYIPDIKGYLPLNNTSLKIRYDYFDMKDFEALYISHVGVIGHQTEQHTNANCDKIIAITKNKNEMSDFSYVKSIDPVGPGLMHIYQHNDCNFYTKALSDDIAKLAGSLRSY